MRSLVSLSIGLVEGWGLVMMLGKEGRGRAVGNRRRAGRKMRLGRGMVVGEGMGEMRPRELDMGSQDNR